MSDIAIDCGGCAPPVLIDEDPPGGWVVANANGDRFRSWDIEGPTWTDDRHAALHFARRRDAEAFSRDDEDAWKIMPALVRG